jgi:hypothetical protein
MPGDQDERRLPSVTRPLALLLVCGVSAFIPTHTLDLTMMATQGYVWGSNVSMSNRPLLDLAMVLQPLTLRLVVVACLWTLRTGRAQALLAAAGAFQALLLLTGLHAYAVDGGSWRGVMPSPFYDGLQVVCALLLVGAAVAHLRQPRGPHQGRAT